MSGEDFHERFTEIYNKAKLTDRGNKKWTAMMLPEHLTELRQDEANYNKVPRPHLDKYDLEYIQDEMKRAITMKSAVLIKLWNDGVFSFRQGTIDEVNLTKRFIVIEDPFGSDRLEL